MADTAPQRLILKAILSLPTPVLRALSGGGVVYRGGRTLDPRFQFFAHAARNGRQIADATPAEARINFSRATALTAGRLEPGVRTEALTIDGPIGPIPLRAYRPASQDPASPVMVFAHSGGGVIGDLNGAEPFCGILAGAAHCAVVSVDYALAPEHRFPAGLEDVMAAYRWVRAHADRFGAEPGRAAIGGDSMGGNFAAVITQQLKQAGEPQPVLQLLIYPAVDMSSETPSMTTYADAFPMSRRTMDWFTGHYFGVDANPADLRASPLRAGDFGGLAPAVVVTAGFDPLVDQGEAYARRLKDAGTPVAYRCYDGLVHGFTSFIGAVPAVDTACREIAGMVKEGFEGRIH